MPLEGVVLKTLRCEASTMNMVEVGSLTTSPKVLFLGSLSPGAAVAVDKILGQP